MRSFKKHTICFTVLAFVFSLNLLGQLKFEDLSFKEAMQKAGESKQLIFLQLKSNCVQCDEVAIKGLSHEKVTNIYNKFICIKLLPEEPDYEKVCRHFLINPTYPTSLFLDHQGNYLNMMYDKSTSRYEEYINLAAVAMSNTSSPPLKEYSKTYKAGGFSKEFLKAYIIELNNFHFESGELLDEYIGMLTVDSLFTPDELKFVLRSAPLVDSRPYKLARFNYEFYDSVFMSLSLKERIRLNSFVISKSRKKAYKEKDENYMRKVAGFVRGTYDDREKGSRAYSNNMLDFYKEVKDTVRYMQYAKSYYHRHLERLDIDAISVKESNDFIKTRDGRIIKSSGRLVVGNQVNKLAWSIYELTDDPENLGMALKWAQRILVYENPAYHDTYAHILYKLGAKQKAIEWQGKAIELGKAVHLPTQSLEAELEKMKTDAF